MSINCRKRLSLLSIVLSVACTGKPANQNAKTTAIIGANDLAPEQDPVLRSTVGQLKISDSSCTSFVTGTNQITSAAHCLSDTQTKDLSAIYSPTDTLAGSVIWTLPGTDGTNGQVLSTNGIGVLSLRVVWLLFGTLSAYVDQPGATRRGFSANSFLGATTSCPSCLSRKERPFYLF